MKDIFWIHTRVRADDKIAVFGGKGGTDMNVERRCIMGRMVKERAFQKIENKRGVMIAPLSWKVSISLSLIEKPFTTEPLLVYIWKSRQI